MTDVPPILEFDPDRSALINPFDRPRVAGTPRAAVACQFPDLVEELGATGTSLGPLPSRGELRKIDFDGSQIAVFYPGQGAPLAAVKVERVLAAGVEVMVACGGAGALIADLPLGHVIVVDSALRDEGTSYHYLPPSREAAANPSVVQVLRDVVEESGSAYTVGKTWTTDGFFRETPGRIRRRRDEGCIAVDAEAAALLAVTEFRGVPFGQLLFAGDDVSGDAHDDRAWTRAHHVQRALFDLAARAALRLATRAGPS